MSDPPFGQNQPEPARSGGFRRTRRLKVLLFATVALGFLMEQIYFLTTGSAPNSAAPIAVAHPRSLAGRVAAAVAGALGPSDRGAQRYRIGAISPDARARGLYRLDLTWAINGDLSLGSVSAGAQLDVYLTLRALYTDKLPLGMVRMTGTFAQLDAHRRSREIPVLRIGLDRATAQAIDWADMDASTVWPLVHRYMVRPDFECQCQE